MTLGQVCNTIGIPGSDKPAFYRHLLRRGLIEDKGGWKLGTEKGVEAGIAENRTIRAHVVYRLDVLKSVFNPETTTWIDEPEYVSAARLWWENRVVERPIHFRTLRRLLKAYLTDGAQPTEEALASGAAKIVAEKEVVAWNLDGLKAEFERWEAEREQKERPTAKLTNLKDRMRARKFEAESCTCDGANNAC
jgi:hypothetical protein